jgi:predicted AAA+ superfamily ATPase
MEEKRLYRRLVEADVIESLENFHVTAIVGPRQCGKSTLARMIAGSGNIGRETLFLDLERPSDLRKLDDAEWFLSAQKDKLVCIDEIQRLPELFPLIRGLADEWDRAGCFLILGSASRELLRQSSESLAGRIVYRRRAPFSREEADGAGIELERYLFRGGFPRSLLASSDRISFEWRQSFIRDFLERDLSFWAGFSTAAMSRLWRMLAHLNGQTVNYSAVAASLGASAATVRNYIDLLASAYMLETVPPAVSNLGKRLVKAPKVYVADSGVCAALLGLRSFEDMAGHPSFGAVWEQVVLSAVRGALPDADIAYYRTNNGAEIDFVVTYTGKTFAVECKASYSPVLSKGNYSALEDIQPDAAFVATPAPESWAMKPSIEAVSLADLPARLRACDL